MSTDNELISRAASEALDVLETPIRGIPSIRVVNRVNAERLLAAAFKTIWEARLEEAKETP